MRATSTFAPPVREENRSSFWTVLGVEVGDRSGGMMSRMKSVLEFFWDDKVVRRGRDMWCVWERLVSRNLQGEEDERR